ncbi:MAG: ABC transporter substrate-binding protein, partial [Chloroflexi bacterium]|nr:ABC transporter substrate-binding protein [Chloroflexota bacterium]
MFRSLEGAGAPCRWLRIPLSVSVTLILLAVMACGSAPPAPALRAESPAPSSAPASPSTASTPAKAAAASVPAPAAAQSAAPAAQQTLTVAIGQVAKNLDPKSTASVTDYNFYRLVMDTLVSVDSGKPEPWLAESWTASDARNWRFKLRQGVRFTNGEEFDAEAVRFSLQRVLDDAKAPARYRIEMIEAINVVDRHTVEFRLKSPVANLPTRLSIFWIVPPKYTQEKGDGFASAPIGTGPFIVKEFQPSVSLTVEANPQYWGGAPKLQSIKFRPIPEASTRIAALQAGEADVIYGLLPEHVDLIKGKGFQIISSPVAITANLFFQQTTDTPLKDVRVRQAIDYAIDKDALLKALTGGHGGALDGQMVGKNSFGYDPSIKARPYDPAKA